MTRIEKLRTLEVVFLDAGHTLLRPEPAVELRYAQTAARYGVAADPAVIKERFSRLWHAGREQRQRLLFRTDAAGTRRFWQEFVGEVFAPWRAEMTNFDAYFDQLYNDFAAGGAWHLFDDVRPSLARLKDALGLRLGVISNWDQRLHDLLADLDIAAQFEVVIVSAEVGYEKPAPEIFQRALQALSLPPERAIHVGDSFDDDVLGARAAGLLAAHLDRQGQTAGQEHVEYLTISSLHNLADQLTDARS